MSSGILGPMSSLPIFSKPLVKVQDLISATYLWGEQGRIFEIGTPRLQDSWVRGFDLMQNSERSSGGLKIKESKTKEQTVITKWKAAQSMMVPSPTLLPCSHLLPCPEFSEGLSRWNQLPERYFTNKNTLFSGCRWNRQSIVHTQSYLSLSSCEKLLAVFFKAIYIMGTTKVFGKGVGGKGGMNKQRTEDF